MTGRPSQTQPVAKEKEKEENIWRRKIFVPRRRRKRGKIFGEGKYLARRNQEREEGKEGKYLEWETSRM